jgi:hypothetical protein
MGSILWLTDLGVCLKATLQDLILSCFIRVYMYILALELIDGQAFTEKFLFLFTSFGLVAFLKNVCGARELLGSFITSGTELAVLFLQKGRDSFRRT